MPNGVVKWFNPEKRYGMIRPDAGGGDVFIQPDVVGDLVLIDGQKVRFRMVFIEGGKAAARNIKVLSDEALSSP